MAARFLILEPAPYAGRNMRTRLYCLDRALWKLWWFRHDDDADLLTAGESDDGRVVELEGVIRRAYGATPAATRLDVQGFAPREGWGGPPRSSPPS